MVLVFIWFMPLLKTSGNSCIGCASLNACKEAALFILSLINDDERFVYNLKSYVF